MNEPSNNELIQLQEGSLVRKNLTFAKLDAPSSMLNTTFSAQVKTSSEEVSGYSK
tara:strand:- start:210 stop:374 length:165 start_codon:yes stop_codon:yes gene_type:complete